MNDCCESINEAYEQLKGELEELRRRTTWQPMETAPLDGSRVLVSWMPCHGSKEWVEVAQYSHGEWLSDEYWRCRPEKWMPLP